jgi:hypothetical protein
LKALIKSQRLSRSLAGQGEFDVALAADGKAEKVAKIRVN